MNICGWTQNEFDFDKNIFDTGCGQVFVLNDGTPKENGFKFCCFCGCEIEEILAKGLVMRKEKQ